MESLLDPQGAHHLALLWHLERVDATDFYFTDHDKDITFESNTYTPVGSLSASAVQKEVGLRAANFEVVGLIESSTITHDDLRAGLYNHAHIREYYVDWRYPWAGTMFRREYWINEIRYSGERWEAQVAGLTTFLKPKVGRVYTRTCPYQLGDAKCTVALTGGNASSGTVSTVTEARRVFTTTLTKTTDWGTFGIITFTGGSNNGLSFEVKKYTETSGTVELFVSTPFDVAGSDSFTITAGCAKTVEACQSFSNIVNFGGFPFIPGTDKMLETPDAKSG